MGESLTSASVMHHAKSINFASYQILLIPFSIVTIQQGVPRGLQGPLAGYGVSPSSSPTLPPEAVQEKRNLKSYFPSIRLS